MKHCLPPAVLDGVTPPKNVFHCFKNTGIGGDQRSRESILKTTDKNKDGLDKFGLFL